MRLERHEEQDTLVLSLKGDLDLTTINTFNNEIDTLMKQGHFIIILDMRECVNIDSTGLGTLVASQRKLVGQGGRLVVTASPKVKKIFETTRLSDAFGLFEDTETALASVKT